MARQTKQQIADQQAAEQATRDAQQAELKRLRAAKRAASKASKAAVLNHVQATQSDPLHANIEDLMADIKLPSAKRVLVGVLLALTASLAVGYGIGMIMSYAIAGVLTLTGSAVIAFMLSVLIWALGLYSAWKVGGYVAGKVFASVVLPDGLASRSYESVANATSSASGAISDGVGAAREKISGWFAKKPAAPVTQGAFVPS